METMTQTQDFTKTLRVGCGGCGNVFVSVKFKGGKLSITGVEVPMRNGDAKGGCGQIVMHDWALTEYAPGFDAATVETLRQVWNKWHLNDMRAGSPAQMAFLEANPVSYKYPESHYKKACEALAAAGLNPDPNYLHKGKPYKYGSAWLNVEVPPDVLDWLQALPDTDVIPALV
jgi:hypothetical protein